jgi:hypothetical protein
MILWTLSATTSKVTPCSDARPKIASGAGDTPRPFSPNELKHEHPNRKPAPYFVYQRQAGAVDTEREFTIDEDDEVAIQDN